MKSCFDSEPEWMRKARTIPLHSTVDSRTEHARLRAGQRRGNAKAYRTSDTSKGK